MGVFCRLNDVYLWGKILLSYLEMPYNQDVTQSSMQKGTTHGIFLHCVKDTTEFSDTFGVFSAFNIEQYREEPLITCR